jgi:hypothetical protein
MIDWYVEGVAFGNCNCAYGCPCQFEALPTHGTCSGYEAMQIAKGHFGDVDLAGVKYALIYAWPGQGRSPGRCRRVGDGRAAKGARNRSAGR